MHPIVHQAYQLPKASQVRATTVCMTRDRSLPRFLGCSCVRRVEYGSASSRSTARSARLVRSRDVVESLAKRDQSRRRSKRLAGDLRGVYPCITARCGAMRLWLSRPRRRVWVGVVACHDDTIRFTDDCQCCSTAAPSPQLGTLFCHRILTFEIDSEADGSQFRPTSGIFEGSLVCTQSVRST